MVLGITETVSITEGRVSGTFVALCNIKLNAENERYALVVNATCKIFAVRTIAVPRKTVPSISSIPTADERVGKYFAYFSSEKFVS